jgi:hypothetical protein
MASIYKNAHVTISATKCASTQETMLPADVDISSSAELGIPLSTRRSVHHMPFIIGTDATWTPAAVISQLFPILTRAWVFQERLLSTRVLHFGPQELSWECRTNVASEYFRELGLTRSDSWPDFLPVPFLMKHLHEHTLASADSQLMKKRWQSIVEEYTSLGLTYVSDRLPAIAGVATQMQEVRSGRYLAGLWSDNFFEDLTWQAMAPADRIDPWQAPLVIWLPN